MFYVLLLRTFLVVIRFNVKFILFYPEMSWVKYNTFSCLFLCTFSIGLHFDVNFVQKRVMSNIIRFHYTV
ncbi:hypothetical protein Hanom_Chr10g00955601 [Helianthus anomalus]